MNFQDMSLTQDDDLYSFNNANTSTSLTTHDLQLNDLSSKHTWLKFDTDINGDKLMSCVYCNISYKVNETNIWELSQFTDLHEKSDDHYRSQPGYLQTFKEEGINQYLMFDSGESSGEQINSHETYGSILKAINKRKLHIQCPRCVSKVVNMSDHLVKKHSITDRNVRKSLMDKVRRNYLKAQNGYKTETTTHELNESNNMTTLLNITKSCNSKKSQRKLIKCPECKNTNKYFVNISDHLIKIHHLTTSEMRKPVLKAIKMSDKCIVTNDNHGHEQQKSTNMSNIRKTLLKRYKNLYTKTNVSTSNNLDCSFDYYEDVGQQLDLSFLQNLATSEQALVDSNNNFINNDNNNNNNTDYTSSSSSSSSTTPESHESTTSNSFTFDSNDLLSSDFNEPKVDDAWNRIGNIEKTMDKTNNSLSMMRQNIETCIQEMSHMLIDLDYIKTQLITTPVSSSTIDSKIDTILSNLNEIQNFVSSSSLSSTVSSMMCSPILQSNHFDDTITIDQFNLTSLIKEELN